MNLTHPVIDSEEIIDLLIESYRSGYGAGYSNRPLSAMQTSFDIYKKFIFKMLKIWKPKPKTFTEELELLTFEDQYREQLEFALNRIKGIKEKETKDTEAMIKTQFVADNGFWEIPIRYNVETKEYVLMRYNAETKKYCVYRKVDCYRRLSQMDRWLNSIEMKLKIKS